MANETPPIIAYQNADGSYNIQLHWQWVDGTADAHGWLLYIKQTDSTTYPDPTDFSEASIVKLGENALSYTLYGVNPTDRFSFAIQAFYNAASGLAKATAVSFQTEAIWDGITPPTPPAPNQDDWIDFQAGDYVDLAAPRTSAQLYEEADTYYILDLVVEDRNDEGTTTAVRAAARRNDTFGTFVTIVPASGMIVVDPFNGSTSYESIPGGWTGGLPVKILRNRDDVILQYRSTGTQSGRVEEIREWVGDRDFLPTVLSWDVSLPTDGDPSKRVLYWYTDDDTEYVKLYTVDRLAPSRVIIGTTHPANGSYEVTNLDPGDEVVISIEPWGRNIDATMAESRAVDVTLRREDGGDPKYALVLEFVDITNDDRYDVSLTFELRERNSNTIIDNIDGGQIGVTTDPGSGFTMSNVNSQGRVTFGPYARPGYGSVVYYFQGAWGDKVSDIRQFTIDEDILPELHQVSYEFDGKKSLVLRATGDDDVAGISIERASDKDFTTNVQSVVYIENTTGDFYYSHVPLPGEHWYVRVRGWDSWDTGAPAVGATGGPYYYANATRVRAKAVEISNLQESLRTTTDSTWEFTVGENVAQVNVMYRDDETPDPAEFNAALPSDTIITISALDPGYPVYSIDIPLPDPDVVRYILFEVLDDSGYVTEIEIVTIFVRQGSPPIIRQRTELETDGEVTIHAHVRSASNAYPVATELFRFNEGTSNWISIDTDSYASAQEKTLISNVALPFIGKQRFYMKAVDSEGLESEVYFDVDRDTVPSATVDKLDRKTNPAIVVDYDDDVLWVRITLPDAKTWTIDSLDAGWGGVGGSVRYTIGTDITDQATTETLLTTGEERGPYLVEVGDGVDQYVTVGTVRLLGPPAQAGNFDLDQDASGNVDIIFSPPDGAQSARYVVDPIDTPTVSELESGTLHVFSTSGYLADNVFTFGAYSGVFVGVIYYFNETGTGSHTSPLYSFQSETASGTAVRVQVDKFNTGSANIEGFLVDVIAVADNTGLKYRVYNEGDTSPTSFTRYPTTPGTYVSGDITDYQITATKPTAVDAPKKILEIIGFDDQGNETSSIIIPVDWGDTPEVVNHEVWRDGRGNLFMSWTLDGDGGSIRVLTSQSVEQSPPSSVQGTAHAGTSDVNVIVATSLDPTLPVYWAITPFTTSGGAGTAGRGIAGAIPAADPSPRLTLAVTPGATSYTVTATVGSYTGATLSDYSLYRDPGTGTFAIWKTELDTPPYTDVINRLTSDKVYRYYLQNEDTGFKSETYTVVVPAKESDTPIIDVDVTPGASSFSFSVTPYDFDGTTVLSNFTLEYATDTSAGPGSFSVWKTEADLPAPFVLSGVTRGAAGSGEEKVVHFRLTNDDTTKRVTQSYTVPAVPSVETVTIGIDVAVVEPTHTVTLDVFPATATLTVELNGAADNGNLTNNGGGNYTYVMTRAETIDKRAVFTASLAGKRSGTATYVIDRDNRPGLSSCTVEDLVKRPRIIAVRDDDAYETQIKVNAAVVAGPSTNATVTWQAGADYADNSEVAFSVEVRKQGAAWLEVASGNVRGPRPIGMPLLDMDITPGANSFSVTLVPDSTVGSAPTNYTIYRSTGSGFSAWHTEVNSPHVDTISRAALTDTVHRYYIRDDDTNYASGVYQAFVPSKENANPILEIDVDVAIDEYTFSVTPKKGDGTTGLTSFTIYRQENNAGWSSWKTNIDGSGPFSDVVARAPPASGLDKVVRYKVVDNDTGFSAEYAQSVPDQASDQNVSVDFDVAIAVNGSGYEVHTLTITVMPEDAVVAAKVNGAAVTLTDNLNGEYEYVLTQTEDEDLIFTVRATDPDYQPGAMTYTLPEDKTPGITGLDIVDRIQLPSVTVHRDNDAQAFRIVVNAVEKLLSTDPSATWTEVTPWALGETRPFNIDVRKTATSSWSTVASGTIAGPGYNNRNPILEIQHASTDANSIAWTVTNNVDPLPANKGGGLTPTLTVYRQSSDGSAPTLITGSGGTYTFTRPSRGGLNAEAEAQAMFISTLTDGGQEIGKTVILRTISPRATPGLDIDGFLNIEVSNDPPDAAPPGNYPIKTLWCQVLN